MSNGELSPMVFSHLAADASSGPFPSKLPKRKKLMKALMTFGALFAQRLQESEGLIVIHCADQQSGSHIYGSCALCSK